MSTITIFNALTGAASQVESNDAEQAHGVDASGASLGVVPLGKAFAHTASPPGPGAGWLWSFELQAWHFTPSMIEAIDAALVSIDAAAGAARLRYITDVPGQAATYLMKLEQAKAFLADGLEQPFVRAEAEAMGVPPEYAAQYIVATAAGWEQLAPMIEKARRAGKVAASGAQNLKGVAEAADAALAALNAI